MAKKSKSKKNFYWDGIGPKDFQNESYITQADLGDFNYHNMEIYAANTNYDRQMPKVFDSLKPVERKIMLVMHYDKLGPTSKGTKSSVVMGNVMKIHPHGDASIYGTMANLVKAWKMQIPLIEGRGNFGTILSAGSESAARYTEVKLSKYAQECFFDDYEEDCIIINENLQNDCNYIIPSALPCKFPNILINGGIGIAFANSYSIPPFNIGDVIKYTKLLIKNPKATGIYMYPDIPSNCDIINDDRSLREICETGKGSLRMRANIDIIDNGKSWTLKVTSLPWLISLDDVKDKIVSLVKAKALDIKDMYDASQPYKLNGYTMTDLDFRVIISKAYDPNQIKSYLYKSTNLEKTLSVVMNVVTEDGLSLKRCNMKELILEWINERREYKRRLLNRKVQKIKERMSLLSILIELLSGANLDKTIKIIKSSNSDDAEDRLIKEYGMNSNQAKRVIAMPLSAFTADAKKRYEAEFEKKQEELSIIMGYISSSKKIDDIIYDEIDDLKKYEDGRHSNIIDVDSNSLISDTDHSIVISKRGIIKKLPILPDTSKQRGLGTFAAGDYPVQEMKINNLDSLMMFDSIGKYSCISVSDIPSCDFSNITNKLYTVAKLDGEVIRMLPFINSEIKETIEKYSKKKISLGFLTSDGLFKRTSFDEYTNLKTIKGIKAIKLKQGDRLKCVDLVDDISDVFIYTKKGNFAIVSNDKLVTMGRDTQGQMLVKIPPDDECVGFFMIPKNCKEIVMLTARGCMKRCEIDYLGNTKKKSVSYMSTLQSGDAIVSCLPIPAKGEYYIQVNTKTDICVRPLSDIKLLARKAHPTKSIPMVLGDNIIKVTLAPVIK